MENQVFLDFGLRFNLRQKKIEKPTIIYAVFMWKGVQHKVNTLLKVYPSHWDSKSQSATVSNRLTKLDNWNNRITNEKISLINALFVEKKSYLCQTLELNVVQEVINIINPKKHIKMKKAKVQKMTSFLKEMLELKATKADSKYRSNINGVEKFLQENDIDDDLALLNGDLLNNYQKWLVKQEKTIGCIRQYIQDLKTLINRGIKSKRAVIDLSTLDILEDRRSIEQKKSKQVPLTEQQVLDIYNLNSLSKKEEEARDLFICQCLLGQRISDMPKIFKGDYTTNKHKKGEETISFNVQKTGELATLFLFPIAKQIINKYRDKKFEYYNLFETDEKKLTTYERTINKTIKDVCLKAGLISEINYSEQIGEQIISKRKPLYELMHTHIARHTFITIMCKRNIPKEIVMIATAHTNDKMINDVYLHESALDRGEKLINSLQNSNQNSILFNIDETKNTVDLINALFAYDKLKIIKQADEDGFNVEQLQECKEVICTINQIQAIEVPTNIDKSFVDNAINEVFPTLLFIADTPTMILFVQKIARLNISNQINESTEKELIKDIQKLGSETEFINNICSIWQEDKKNEHLKKRLFGIEKRDDRVMSLEDSLKEIYNYVRKKVTIEENKKT